MPPINHQYIFNVPVAKRPLCFLFISLFYSAFCHWGKRLEVINLKGGKILVHGFRGFDPWSLALSFWACGKAEPSWQQMCVGAKVLTSWWPDPKKQLGRAGYPYPFEDSPPVTSPPSTGPPPEFCHHPVVPQAGDQAFDKWALGGHVRSKPNNHVCSPPGMPNHCSSYHNSTVSHS